MKTFVAFFYLLVVTAAWGQGGGYGAGNGGNSVVCYSDSSRSTITSVKMFDYWEQHSVHQFPGGINLGDSHFPIQKKIGIFVSRIAKFDKEMADKVKTVALSMANNMSSFLVTEYQLPEIKDSNPLAIPSQPNCFIEQFAVQWKEPTSGKRRFAIADKLYNSSVTSNDTKVGIILHEALYRYAITNGATDSDGVRFLNYVASTNKLDTANSDEYFKFVQNAKMNYKGCEYKTFQVDKGPQVKILIRPSEQPKSTYQTCYAQELMIGDNVKLNLESGFDFYGIYTLRFVQDKTPLDLQIRNQEGVFQSYKAERVYFEKGAMELFPLSDVKYDFKIKPNFSNAEIECVKLNKFSQDVPERMGNYFFDLGNGLVKACMPAQKEFTYMLDGRSYQGEALHFDNKSNGTTRITFDSELNLKIPGSSRVYTISKALVIKGNNITFHRENILVDQNFTAALPEELKEFNNLTVIDLPGGLSCEMVGFNLDRNGQIECAQRHEFLLPLDEQKISMESFAENDSNGRSQKIETLCKKQDSRLTYFPIGEVIEEVYVENENVLNLKTGQQEHVTDRYVKVLKQIGCYVSVQVNP